MKVYYNNTTSAYKADFNLDDDNYLEVVMYKPVDTTEEEETESTETEATEGTESETAEAESESESEAETETETVSEDEDECPYEGYEEIGRSGLQLESHGSYSLLLTSMRKFLNRNKDNTVSQSDIKLISTNKVTYGSRMKYEEVDNRYAAYAILQVDTNTISSGVTELQVVLFRVKPANVTFNVPSSMTTELVSYSSDELFTNGSKRHFLWDTYALEIDGVEYRFSEKGVNQTDADPTISMGDREYVEMTVRKYSNGFEEALTRLCDDDTVLIEATAGIANTQRVQLTEGVGTFRWYNLGYTGDFKIKLGWRWYSGVAEVKLTVGE